MKTDTDTNDSKNCKKDHPILKNPALSKPNSTLSLLYRMPKDNPQDQTGIEKNNLESKTYRQ